MENIKEAKKSKARYRNMKRFHFSLISLKTNPIFPSNSTRQYNQRPILRDRKWNVKNAFLLELLTFDLIFSRRLIHWEFIIWSIIRENVWHFPTALLLGRLLLSKPLFKHPREKSSERKKKKKKSMSNQGLRVMARVFGATVCDAIIIRRRKEIIVGEERMLYCYRYLSDKEGLRKGS